jgi:hypothetical protein
MKAMRNCECSKPPEEKPSSASVPPSRQDPDIRQMYLDSAKQWKELAQHAVGSRLISRPIEE